jgi:hypothetical protein
MAAVHRRNAERVRAIDPDRVDERRAQIGLPPLAQTRAEHRKSALQERPPKELEARRSGFEAWPREVGWR